jgi:hypothetical protein
MGNNSCARIGAAPSRQTIEVKHMDATHDDPIVKYTAMLKAKVAHMSALSAEDRVGLQQQWSRLIEEVKGALDEDPAGPRGQSLLDRWLSLLHALTGTDTARLMEHDAGEAPFRATPELRDELWSRRAEWLPADAAKAARETGSAEEALAQVRERMTSLADPRVVEFIQRARAARR